MSISLIPFDLTTAIAFIPYGLKRFRPLCIELLISSTQKNDPFSL
jgi:hypothetical protein